MSKTLLLYLLLFSPYELARAATTTPQGRQGNECNDVPACREEIKRLKAELEKISGGAPDPQKQARRAALDRSLRKTASKLARLEGRGSIPRKRSDSLTGGGTTSAPPSPDAPPPNNDALLSTLLLALNRPEKQITEQTEKNGNIQVVKDLSVGVLKVEYDKDVKAGSTFRLTATITPRNIIEESRLKGLPLAPVNFYVEPHYEPVRSAAVYNNAVSGGAELREFRPDNSMTWVWDVTPPEGFASDKADLVLRAQFRIEGKASDWREVSRSEIEFKESDLRSWVIANANLVAAVIGLLAGALTFGGGVLPYVARRKARKFKELHRNFISQQAYLKAQDRELSDLKYVYGKLEAEYDAFKQRWERLTWVRQSYR